MERERFWSPYVAGAGIGLTLLAALYIFNWGLGASSAFSLLAAVAVKGLSPEFAGSLKYFSRQLSAASPLKNWVLFEVGGLFLGAFTGSILSGTIGLRFERGGHLSSGTRLLTAFAGGTLIGFSSRLARGCTSGVGLSGGAQLALSGWIFLISMFVSGLIAAAFLRRLWT